MFMLLFVRLQSLLTSNAVTLHTLPALTRAALLHPINNRLLPHCLNPAHPTRFLQHLRYLNLPIATNSPILLVP